MQSNETSAFQTHAFMIHRHSNSLHSAYMANK